MLYYKTISGPAKSKDCTNFISEWVKTLGSLTPFLAGDWKRISKKKDKEIVRVFELKGKGVTLIVSESDTALTIAGLSIGALIVKSSAKFLKLNPKEFADKFNKIVEATGEEGTHEGFPLYEILDINTVKAGMNIEFDGENTESSAGNGYCGTKLTGIQQLGDLTFLGVTAGGDWESPVFFILYFDADGELRSYIPKDGNIFNTEAKSAFGNDEETDEKVLKEVYKVEDASGLEFQDEKLLADIKNTLGA